MDKKIIVISGVNLIDAGPLSVFYDFLDSIIEGGYSCKYHIIALVGNKKLFEKYKEEIELMEFKKSKKSWFNRMYLEYFGFNKIFKKHDIYIWISMHDITPNVKAQHMYVYCHNPSPFLDMSIREINYGFKYYLFSKFYKYLYKINIKKNDAVIVQQNWMREEFCKIYNLNKIIVARPNIDCEIPIRNINDSNSKKIFIFPSFPRFYKNFQIACEAAVKLKKEGYNNFELIITLSGNENNYSKYLKDKYKDCNNILFAGLMSREKLFDLYSESDCLIFMSKLETWGMPITEYKNTNKPMIVSDLPYAYETVGEYNNVEFIKVDDLEFLCKTMIKVINGEKLSKSKNIIIDSPFARNWNELCEFIFDQKSEIKT